jgi:carbon monoxide dehydrogenase subunit G
MKIQNRFEVPMPPHAAWPLLMDIACTAPCFPGAELLEKIDEDNYKGRVSVKLGPLAMIFVGNLRIEQRDEAAHAGTVKATWNETRGRGNAVATTSFAMHELAGGTEIVVDSDIQLAGQIAQYGRATGMIADISGQLVSKFAENLRAKIASAGGTPAGSNEISALGLLGKAAASRVKRAITGSGDQ